MQTVTNILILILMLALPAAPYAQSRTSIDIDFGYARFSDADLRHELGTNPMINKFGLGVSRSWSPIHDGEIRIDWTHEKMAVDRHLDRSLDVFSLSANLKLYPITRRYLVKPFVGFGVSAHRATDQVAGSDYRTQGAGFNLLAGSVFRIARYAALTTTLSYRFGELNGGARDITALSGDLGIKIYLK